MIAAIALFFATLTLPEPWPAACASRAAHAARVGGDVQGPVVIRKGNVDQTLARHPKTGCPGLLIFELLITPSGDVACARIVKIGRSVAFTPEIVKELDDAARRFRFKPAMRGGKPVEALYTVTFNFKCN